VADDEVERLRAIVARVHQQPPAGKLEVALRKVTARLNQGKAAIAATLNKHPPKKDAA
jgi:hypothetical protein